MTGKGLLLEEATRVPLIVSFPGRIREGTAVSEPASHLDLFATILDYLGVPSELNGSDGQSLRRFIEGTSWNQWYDESTVVAELDRRIPDSKDTFTGSLGDIPNFMIRKGNYKLIVPRKRDSPVRDMMYDLQSDPFEMTNLLSDGASNEVIGMAEHLKALLVEWLRRKDTDSNLYSSNKWNLGEGRGDVAEVQNRRTWRELPYWQSGSVLAFGEPVLVDRSSYQRREFLYVGRTSDGTLTIDSIYLRGQNASYFSLSGKAGRRYRIRKNNVVRIGVTFQSPVPVRMADLDAEIVISNDVSGESVIRIIGAE
jgi:Sulfatase